MFFITSKILMRLNIVFFLESLQQQNVLMFLFTMKYLYLLTANAPPDVNNSLIFTWYEKATAGNSLHIRSNFCLIKDKCLWVDEVCICHVILL